MISVKSKIDDFFAIGLERSAVEPRIYRRLYMANAGIILGFMVLVTFGIFYQWISPFLSYLCLFSAAVCAGLLLLNIKTWNPLLVGRAACVYFFVYLVALIFALGGIQSVVVAWLLVVPLIAALIVGQRDAWFWTIASCLAVFAFYLADIYHFSSSVVINAKFLPALKLLQLWTLLLFLGALITIGLQRHRLLERQLGESLAAQRDKTETAELLAKTASAANEEIAFDRAVIDCLRILCQAQDWSAGHLWVVNEHRVIEATDIWYFDDAHHLRPIAERALGEPHSSDLARRVLDQGYAIIESEGDATSANWGQSLAAQFGMASQFAWPVFSLGRITAVLEFFSREKIEFDNRTDELVSHIALQLSHVRGRETSRQRIENMAFYDMLTGLPNRFAFERSTNRILDAAKRSGTRVALMFIDLDSFKRVNDSLGHSAGDELLRIVAQRLQDNIRPSDIAAKFEGDIPSIVARLGGDEFTVLLQGLEHSRDAEFAARRFLDVLASPVRLAGTELAVNASIGIAIYPDDATELADLLRLADAAMYESKKHSGSHFHFATESLNERLQRESWIEQELRRAVTEGVIDLHLQPIVQRQSHEVIAYEALARWFHDDGVIEPEEFIPIAEDVGLIHELGTQIMRRAAAAAVEINRDEAEPITVHLNVSPHQLRDERFVERVEAVLAETGCEARWLRFEFTENALIVDDEKSRLLLDRLGKLGIKFVLDDFGTGYASLVYLRQFPFSIVKIDRSFVRDMDTNRDDEAIIHAIISMAHSLNLPVAAEGVETLEHAQLLDAAGCDMLQGDYFDTTPAVSNA